MSTALPLMFLLFAGIWPFGASKTYRMIPAKEVPAASGTVNVHTGTNGNTKLDIKVKHLAAPAKLTPPAGAYVAWVKPNSGKPIELGVIKVDGNLSGELTATMPYKSADILITPEPNRGATSPTAPPVLKAHVTAG